MHRLIGGLVLLFLLPVVGGCSDDGTSLSEIDADPAQLTVGDRFFGEYNEHPSTGLIVEASISNPDVVEVVERRFEQTGPGGTGGDAGIRTIVLEAIAEGTSTVSFAVTFQGDVEREDAYTIEVVADG